MAKSGNQVRSGKAFEYALAKEYYNFILSEGRKVFLVEDSTLKTARQYYDEFDVGNQQLYDLSARASIPTMMKLEPGFLSQSSDDDAVYIRLASDQEGSEGDVRDVIFHRPKVGWQVGFSAKNNNDAVKHSRLSMSIDFGEKWLGYKVSDNYWNKIRPIFEDLTKYRSLKLSWADLHYKKYDDIYIPLLNAFMDELKALDSRNCSVPQKLVQYLIGEQPFYKIIKDDIDNVIIVKAFNINGGLNQTVSGIKPMYRTRPISLPSRIVEIDFMNKGEEKNSNTIDLILDGGWEISFRIHNASTLVEPSLKFDVRLLGNPPVLFTQYIFQE